MTKKTQAKVLIHGKEYETVAYRVQKFRDEHPSYVIKTELVERTPEDVVMKCSILDDSDRLLSTGYAEERRAATMINKTSALENCETSAIGRALAAFGMGGTEFASADEVANAISQQASSGNSPSPSSDRPMSDKQKQFIMSLFNSKYPNGEFDILEWAQDEMGINLKEATSEQASAIIEELQS